MRAPMRLFVMGALASEGGFLARGTLMLTLFVMVHFSGEVFIGDPLNFQNIEPRGVLGTCSEILEKMLQTVESFGFEIWVFGFEV